MDKSKPFGLIITKRAQQSRRPAVSAVFGSDSDDEPSAKKKKMPSIPQAKPKKQLLPEMSEDPSIFEYDSIYDDMKAKEVAKVAPKDSSKPSRYIESLLKAADKRKKDQERRVEKKVHHERELEGDKFADKESFVTSAYKKKMQEMEEEEERERRENMLNEMMDVTKQKDLSGFYRHFLKQSVGEETVPVFGERYAKKEQEVAVKEERVSDEEVSGSVDSAMPKSKKERHNVGRAGNMGSEMPKTFKNQLVVKKKKPSVEAGSVDSAMLGTSKEEETLDGNVDRDTDMDTSSDDDEGKVAVVGKSSSKKDGDDACRGKDIGSRKCKTEKKEVLDVDVDRDTDMGSSSEEDGRGLKDSSLGKSSKKHVLSEKAQSLLDDNVDRDTDIESSSDEEAPDGKSKDTAVAKSSKKNVHSQKSSSLVDNDDKDSDSSGEDEDDKAASCSPSKAVFKKPSSPKNLLRKRSENSGKQHRNIRKRAKDVDSSPDSEESSPASDAETSEEPKSNGGSKEGPSISESVKQVKTEPPKPKVDIFAKRTVGDVFADAQVRYFQRMAARSA